MAIYNNKLTQKVYEILVPLMGDMMAQNVVKIQTRKIGKDIETLALEDMPKLAETIRVGLVIFIGSSAAKDVALKITLIK